MTSMIEALDWPALVRPGDLVVCGQASAEPTTLIRSLMAVRDRIGGFRVFIGIGCSDSFDPSHCDRVAFSSYCGTGTNRRFGSSLDILPIPYTEIAATLGREAPVLLLSLAPGADETHFSLGAAGDYTADLLGRARLVIAEVNMAAPRTGSGFEVPRDRIDILVHSNAPLPMPGAARAGDVDEAIASHIADMVENGSTLQIGLGALPAAVLRALGRHRDLGIHSGLIGDEVVMLAESGVLTNARKTIDTGISVTGLLAGGDGLMRWADRNPALSMRPTSYTHDPAVLASIDRLVAINSAIEVDLTGQVNAETAGGRYVGAIGGAGAFLRGAHASRGGLPIIALPASAGSASRIVARLSGPVSTPRSDVGLVVTEHGVADLRGLSLRARRQAMLAIAAPEHRAALDIEPSL